MRTIRTKLYKFSELTEKAQQRAMEDLCSINVDFDWWESIILQKECDYLQSFEAIKETIEVNDYEFTQDGKRF